MSIQDTKPSARGQASTAGPGRHEAADARRERVVRQPPLFLKNGYDSISIDDIIEVVGGKEGDDLCLVGGKEELFEAVVRKECRDVTMAIRVTRPAAWKRSSRDRSFVPSDGAFAAGLEFTGCGFDRPKNFPKLADCFTRPGQPPRTASWRHGSRSSSKSDALSKTIRIAWPSYSSTC